MKYTINPQDQVFFYIDTKDIQPLTQKLETDIVVIGGGMAGISAAQAFAKRGKQVILLEKNFCGSGATGKSSGFITPNSELSFSDFKNRFGQHHAQSMWNYINNGLETIRNNITNYAIDCDFIKQDTIAWANTEHALKKFKQEYENLSAAGYDSFFVTRDKVANYLNTDKYFGGVGYKNSFGINAYLYCQQMKTILQKNNVQVFEESPVVEIKGHTVFTAHGQVTAKHIIVCADRFTPEFTPLKKEIFQIQTFILLSEPLTDVQIRSIFPNGLYMCWDSDLIYTYFRLTADKRLIVGGGDYFTTYAGYEIHNYQRIIRKLTDYVQHKFSTARIQFEYMWPGLIGISKDIDPIAGYDKHNKALYYAGACAGLPISAATGIYAAEHIIDGRKDLDAILTPYRSYPIGNVAQSILGKRISFALSNLIKIMFP